MKPDQIVVLHSTPDWLPQTMTWLHNQAKYLPETFDVHVVCERTMNLDQFGQPNIHSLLDVSRVQYVWQKGMRKLFIRQFQDHLYSVGRAVHAQLVHSHFGDIGWNNVKAVKKLGAMHVVTFYGYDVNRLPTENKKWISRYAELFDQADLFLCEGPFMAKELVRMGCPPGKVKVHHLGVDVEDIAFRPRKWEKGMPLRILIASSFREKKGIPYALEALARLPKEIALEITIIGDATSLPADQEEKRRILQVIETRGLSANTRLLGFKPYSVLFEEAYKHHVFLSPSVTASDGDTEGGAPVSLIDMQATGMPVVSTTHCDIPEVVQYGLDDWLVNERDVKGLVDRLLWLVDHPLDWESLAHAGRRHMELEFNADEQGNRLGHLYKEIVDDRKA